MKPILGAQNWVFTDQLLRLNQIGGEGDVFFSYPVTTYLPNG